jgi:AcrR family transcriptional regulator
MERFKASKKRAQKTVSSQTTTVTKTPTKRPRVADGRLSEFMATAADVFIEQGFDKTSLQEIAQRTGASKATLYGRYPNKEALFSSRRDGRAGRAIPPIF